MLSLPVVGGVFAVSLAVLGFLIDASRPLPQPALWAGIQLASLGGAGLGLAAAMQIAGDAARPGRFAIAALVGWRLAYFPIMVFSGHVASIGEWILTLVGAPVLVYPTFLIAVAAIHVAAALAVIAIVTPPLPWLRWALVPAFVVAACVSFLSWRDFHPLPDRAWTLDESIPPMAAEGRNPYLEALFGPGYWPNQRVILVAAGLTYDTIPPSPWATTVKAVLEVLFDEKPNATSHDRVVEHYRAYHSAHIQIGCTDLAECPVDRCPGAPDCLGDPCAGADDCLPLDGP